MLKTSRFIGKICLFSEVRRLTEPPENINYYSRNTYEGEEGWLQETLWKAAKGLSPAKVNIGWFHPEDVNAAKKNLESDIESSRVGEADLNYPIIVQDGRIVDGFHRLAKLLLDNAEYGLIVDLKTMPKPDFIITGRIDKMGMIDVAKTLQDKPSQWIAVIKRLPELLQKEILDERPNPDEEDIRWVSSWKVASQPTKIKITDLLQNQNNLDSIARCPADVVQEINRKWRLQIKPGQVYDRTPERYKEYAKFSGNTAKPSVMVDGEIIFGVGRFIAALIRGDQQLMVWDIRT